MQSLKGFLRNLGALLIIGLVFFVLFPDIMKQVFQLYGALLGPFIVLILIAAALPRKRRNRP